MKKWQEFLLWVVCFAFIDVVFEFIKSLAENGTLSKWTFALVALVMLVVGWIAAFVGAKSLKNKKNPDGLIRRGFLFVIYLLQRRWDFRIR